MRTRILKTLPQVAVYRKWAFRCWMRTITTFGWKGTVRLATDYRQYLQPETVSKLKGMELRARHGGRGFIAGLHKSPYHGFSVEFAEHRQYMPGDDIRRIDWKVFAKTDRHFISSMKKRRT